MTTEEIQNYVHAAVTAAFASVQTESGEMMTSEGGDGRFHGRVVATLYSGLEGKVPIYLAIGETVEKVQIIKLGNSECLKPMKSDLDVMLLKELGIEVE